jgi:hypothetical protein
LGTVARAPSRGVPVAIRSSALLAWRLGGFDLSNEKNVSRSRIATPFVHRLGDEQEGFELLLDRTNRLVRARFWGVWDNEMVEEFRAGVLRFSGELSGSPWSMIVDSRNFPAQNEEITRHRLQTMKMVVAQGSFRKLAAVVTTATYGMQFRRMTDESHMQSGVFRDEQSALEWIRAGTR